MLTDARSFRTLNLAHDSVRGSLAIEVDASIIGREVTRVLGQLGVDHSLPSGIVVGNGLESASHAIDERADVNDVELVVARPGRPTDAFVSSFTPRSHGECVNLHVLTSLTDAKL